MMKPSVFPFLRPFLAILAVLMLQSPLKCHARYIGCSFVAAKQLPSSKATRSRSTIQGCHQQHDDDHIHIESPLHFPAMGHRPLLAVITAPDACDSQESTEATYEALREAVSSNQVDLINVRLTTKTTINEKGDTREDAIRHRAVSLTRKLVELSKCKSVNSALPLFHVVCSSDLVSVAVEAKAHGVHVKEHHWPLLPEIMAQFDYPILIGISAHSLASKNEKNGIQPHYYFVGTCYLTASHPEKAACDLEGPELPGIFKATLNQPSIPIFAIGGIDQNNCHEPVALGADGVAVIRSVVQAVDPAGAVRIIQDKMKEAVK
ncbi:thiamine-phosphate diphosphorylase [Nitzschia inconspicua]|uniref:Thiamine-phosphate diphosphorylase n=1 Tax=Nitzschia inconspicua TaxID=303405 RepID=A0A9K3Q3Q9_9STRA|nr:thiamine-phosphate diphosphorylase [Nitzschia inconspicua]